MENTKYTITDLYIAAYLKAIGKECEIENRSGRCHFHFDAECKEIVQGFIKTTSKDTHNVNAIALVNEIKQLKAYVNNS